MNRRNLLQGLSGAALATVLTPELAQAAAQIAKGAAAASTGASPSPTSTPTCRRRR